MTVELALAKARIGIQFGYWQQTQIILDQIKSAALSSTGMLHLKYYKTQAKLCVAQLNMEGMENALQKAHQVINESNEFT